MSEINHQFSSYSAFVDYLKDRGWVTESGLKAIVDVCATFEATQRRKGAELAKDAMIKAVDRLR